MINYSIYDKGVEKLNEELDVISILNSIRSLKMMIKMNLTYKQIILSKFSKVDTISYNLEKDVQKLQKEKGMKWLGNKLMLPTLKADAEVLK